jgi:polysaccharide deacetylase family protein (PEP-CTERM system associated)
MSVAGRAARRGGGEYVFSVDLEDVRMEVPDGALLPARVPITTGLYLDFLAARGAIGTFFVVGDVARAHPELVRRIVAEGHEIGCHSDRHIRLDEQGPNAFRDDVRRNLDVLYAAGVETVHGYRAPCFSLTERTSWAYPILAELGFTYSSSVLPARNPISGWPGFGAAPRKVDGLLELPITLMPYRLIPVPMGGGIYFRVLPAMLVRRAFQRRAAEGHAVLGYLHPYDIDNEQRVAHRGFSRWGLSQWLLQANRGKVLRRLEGLDDLGFSIVSYGAHARSVLDGLKG